jgi:hypothetical protein
MSVHLRVVREPRPPDRPAGAQLTASDILRRRRWLDGAHAGLAATLAHGAD